MADIDSSLPIKTRSNGDVRVDGSVVDIGNTVTVQGTDLDIRDLVFATDKVDASGSSVSVSNTVDVSATDLDIRDLSAATDSVSAHLKDEAGVAFSAANPLPVVIASDAEGDEICDYKTTASVASDATVNHDYTVTAAKTFLGEEAWASASGEIKVELLVNGAVKFVGFSSASNKNVRIPLKKILKGQATEAIRIAITNLENQAQDVYSTLLGLEI